MKNISLFLEVYKEKLLQGELKKENIKEIIKKHCNFIPKDIHIDASKGFLKFEANPIERSVFLEHEEDVRKEIEKFLGSRVTRIS